MYPAERQRSIVGLVSERGRVSVADLAERFGVTPETVRRDLELLDEQGLVQRVHGGAVPALTAPSLPEVDLTQRQGLHSAEKQAIGRRALEYLPGAGGSMILDAGTTTAQFAAQVPDAALPYTVTNSVAIGALVSARDLPITLLGGRVRGITQSIVGVQAVEDLSRLRVDVAFLGTNGLTLAHGLSTPDPDEAMVKRAMIAAARRRVLLADSSKFGAEALVSFAAVGDIDTLITDAGLPADTVTQLTDTGIEVVLA